MASDTNNLTQTIGSTCTHYTGAEVSITVPGPGTIVVSANVKILLDHTWGTESVAHIVVHNTTNTCNENPYVGIAAIPSGGSTSAQYYFTIPILITFSVSAAGTYTYNVNGRILVQQNAGDVFLYSTMVAVFYPS